MVAILTLAEAKAHLKIAGNDEDGTLTLLVDAAEDYLGRIGCPVDADPLPPALKAAALLGVQALWATRSDLALKKDSVAGIGTFEMDQVAADKILTTTIDRLVASVREVSV
ncbi:head-tail connector protein [Pleomorphomonas sp. JP5]|uniref:head-tail connector protein n=1 Tax=Pleomorphomonas sp. JP5 TaxID=2942998 RepID=UPI0020437D1C|nr:head-tail connector protein [Pleomorphomonas sp. JP5]MCM5558076.1 head-tail connector protein [Pleomorphomonas sp. JP5]